MIVAVIALLYGLLLYVLLGGFLLTVCTDYPEVLREYRKGLMRTNRRSYTSIALLVLIEYLRHVLLWPKYIRKYRF